MAARGPRNDLRAALESHLGQDARHVVLDGLLGNAELVANLTVCEPLAHEFDNATLHGGQAAKDFVVTDTNVLTVLLARRREANGLDHLLRACGLRKEHVGARCARCGARLVVVVARENDNMGVRKRAAHVSDQLEAGAVRKAKIGEHHVGAHGIGAAHCLRDGACLGDDLDAIGAIQDVADAAADDFVVVQDQNSDVAHVNRLTLGPDSARGQGPGSHAHFSVEHVYVRGTHGSHVRWS